ncbi:phosphoribosylglycinamide formyltransferase [Aureibaculum luteum]|uniref:phosphoribosylglycinamide formyltransferase n=1 Tax=Aureibaculum luteum TaxID=1548456 RepID=UPI000E512DB1|nr:phosphoribosylglycinamide formyltransferase [Aureibaculum luteum]
MKRIVILASGSGTNAENIIKYFQKSNVIAITQVLSNKKDAKVLERAKRLNVSSYSFDRDTFYKSDKVLNILKTEADYIVLAGFLWKIPENIIEAFGNKIINIHPALLPKYGGKGMYGDNVHKSVVVNKEDETGITIHFVNENYDEGAIIFQAKVAVTSNDNFTDVAKKVHQLEYEHFPRVIEETILKHKSNQDNVT